MNKLPENSDQTKNVKKITIHNPHSHPEDY